MSSKEIKVIGAEKVVVDDIKSLDMLILGSPTHGGQPSNAIRFFLNKLPNNSLKGIKVAVYDTRLSEKGVNFVLRLLIKTIGYAAKKIANALKNKGGELIDQPKGFFVESKEGPLKDGEFSRAKEWAAELEKAGNFLSEN